MTYVQYSLNYPAAALGDRFGATAGRSSPHRGRDVAPDGGGPVYAIADGILVSDWYSPGLGNVPVLAHADGKFSGYSHCAAESPRTLGTLIRRGEAFATIGNTGSLSRGRHLHLTIATSLAGAAGGFDVIDPDVWIASHANPIAGTAGVAASGLHTSTEQDGEPGRIYWTKVQSECRARGWYTGAVDGIPGPVTHKAHARLQASILNERRGAQPRTTTADDGIPGPVFWTLAQIIGRGYGYTGRADGIPGGGTLRALYRITGQWLNRHGR